MANVFIAEGAESVGAPNSGDSLFALGGGATINTNLDQSALAAGLVRVEVSKAYTGQFGSAGAPFKTKITTAIVYAAAAGDMYYRAQGQTSPGDDTAALIYHIGGGHFHFVTGGTATRYEQLSGIGSIAAPCVVTNFRMAGGQCTIFDDSSTDPTVCEVYAGQLTTERGGTTLSNHDGTMVIDAATNTITTLNCLGRTGNTILKESGTITTLNATGHIPDVSQLTRPVTVTDTNINMSLPGAQAFLDHPLITFSNSPQRRITDGRKL